MPAYLIVILSIVSFIALVIIVLTLISRCYYKRSLMATVSEWYLRVTENKLPDEQVINELPLLPLLNDKKVFCPKKYSKLVKTEEYDIDGIQTFVFNNQKSTNTCAIYLHGAGYVRQPRKQHWKFVTKLAKKSGITVVFPIYPKAPNHTYEESYSKITKLYLDLRDRFEKVVLMGDSSGGGLALGLAEDFIKKDIKQPDQLILISPWVDITLENTQIVKYEKTDPIVCVSNDRIWGKSWAGGKNLKNYKVSPIYGNMLGLKSVTLFVGTREALYPDIKILEEILKDSKAKVKTFIGKGLNHVYPIFPIPEAKKAMKNIIKIILN